jgi:hypothetical protein
VTLAAVGEDVVVAELWVSLVSLIQSYVAGHEVGKTAGGAAMDRFGEDERGLAIESDGKTLRIDCAAGVGEWVLHDNGVGPEKIIGKGVFHIGADSMVEFSDRKGKLELDIAAEAFTAKIFDED